MTDEERKNRNPKPEISTFSLDECPIVALTELQLHRVYILRSARLAASWNYMGKGLTLDPRTLEPVVAYHFHAPRIDADCFLTPTPDGSLQDLMGHRIEVRLYTGPDQ